MSLIDRRLKVVTPRAPPAVLFPSSKAVPGPSKEGLPHKHMKIVLFIFFFHYLSVACQPVLLPAVTLHIVRNCRDIKECPSLFCVFVSVGAHNASV